MKLSQLLSDHAVLQLIELPSTGAFKVIFANGDTKSIVAGALLTLRICRL
jgi:hypothetical protein